MLRQLLELLVLNASTVSKAIAGFLAGALVSVLAQSGLDLDVDTVNAVEVAISGLITAVIVWVAPKNREN